MSSEQMAAERNLVLAAVIAAGIIGVFWSLGLSLCRERIKADLRDRGCIPIKVRRRFFASDKIAYRFAVEYLDPVGTLRSTTCTTPLYRNDVLWAEPSRMVITETLIIRETIVRTERTSPNDQA